MARSSAALVAAEGAAPSGSAPSVSWRPSKRLAKIRRTLLTHPSQEMVVETCRLVDRMSSCLAEYTATALSPCMPVSQRGQDVHAGQRLLGRALYLIDACTHLPARWLRLPGLRGRETVLSWLQDLVHHLWVLSATLDRAAVELGLPIFDGGPFAVAPLAALPGRPLLGGAR